MILEMLLNAYVCIQTPKYLEKLTKAVWFKFSFFFLLNVKEVQA